MTSPGAAIDASGGTAVDAVVFDLGNVLIGWDPFGAYLGLSRDEVETFFAETDFLRHNHEQDAGRSWAELRDLVAADHPEHARLVDMYVENFAGTLTGPVEGSAELVAELVAGPTAVFGLTNWSAELFHHAAPAAPAIGLLQDILVSGEVGLAKPDPAIFAMAVERFGLDAGRTVFVDDSLANVEAADACGLRGVHFTTTAAFRDELVRLGVLPAR